MVDLKEAIQRSGLSEKTLRRHIRAGNLEATLVGRGQHRRYEITEEALDGLLRTEYGHMMDTETRQEDRKDGGHRPDQSCPNCEWVKGQLEVERTEKESLLKEKDKQIEQLHVLLQQAQERVNRILPPPRKQRWWWPW